MPIRSRTIRALGAAAALVLAAGACGSDDDADSAESTTTAAEATTTVAEPAETSAPEADETETTDETEMTDDESAEAGTIVDVAAANGSFTTLVAAVDAAGLVDTLSGEGPFTVFAPTDDAFVAALESLGLTAEELLADTELLTSVLTYHVVADAVPAADVVTLDGQSVATVNGAEVSITVDGDTVMVNDATVTAVDVEASNGIIHVIDSVLLPPG